MFLFNNDLLNTLCMFMYLSNCNTLVVFLCNSQHGSYTGSN